MIWVLYCLSLDTSYSQLRVRDQRRRPFGFKSPKYAHDDQARGVWLEHQPTMQRMPTPELGRQPQCLFACKLPGRVIWVRDFIR
jgi:hypothetical protein